MRKVSIIAFVIWAGGNFLLAAGILVALLCFRQNAPSMWILFARSDFPAIDSRAVATINGLAVFANGCAAAFCALVLFAVWRILFRSDRAWFWPVCICTSVLQCLGYASDRYFSDRNLRANVISSIVLVIGLAALHRNSHHDRPKGRSAQSGPRANARD